MTDTKRAVKFNAQFLFLILLATGCSWEYPENYPPNNADGKACRRICGEWEYFKETPPCFISCSTYPNPIGGAWCRFKCNAGIEIKSRSDIEHEEYLREIKERREYYGKDE